MWFAIIIGSGLTITAILVICALRGETEEEYFTMTNQEHHLVINEKGELETV